MEWWKPFEEVWKGHRHKSHLYGLYPGRQITLRGTPELAKAAEQSLAVRMDPEERRLRRRRPHRLEPGLDAPTCGRGCTAATRRSTPSVSNCARR